ncbi:hypothetical protein GW17_00041567 [Ensete ventricosum]|nr:hypothetical protein GW17_00041567 [Ensete ventricosum]
MDRPLSGGTIEIGRRRSIATVGGRLREKEEEGEKEREKRGRYLLFPGSPGDSSPMGFLLPARGDEARNEKE